MNEENIELEARLERLAQFLEELKTKLERLARLLEEHKNHKQDKQPVDYDEWE
jgi:hypothetical protein